MWGFSCLFRLLQLLYCYNPGCHGLLSVKNRLLRKAWGLVTVSVAAQIGTAPLVMLYFSRFSTHFLLTNLLVIPLVSLIVYAAVILLVLTPFPVLQQLFADVVEIPLRMQNALLRWIEQLPLASIDRIWVDIWDVFLFYCCLLLFCRVWMRRTAANVYIALSALLLCVSYHSYAFITDAPRRSLFFIMSVAVRQCIVWQITPLHGWSAPIRCPMSPGWNVRFLPTGAVCAWNALT